MCYLFEFDVVVFFLTICDLPSTTSPCRFQPKAVSLSAPAKSGAGIGTLKMLQATYDAPASFMSCARLYLNGGLGGAPQGAPVACNAGSSNPFSPPP
ncbi:hypothetical protein DMN57_02150 [Escherichia coli]|nr:hypothetical protein [Escherichia coli]